MQSFSPSSPKVRHMSQIWPQDQFPLRRVGKLTLNQNIANFFNEAEQLAFSPAHILPGEACRHERHHSRAYAVVMIKTPCKKLCSCISHCSVCVIGYLKRCERVCEAFRALQVLDSRMTSCCSGAWSPMMIHRYAAQLRLLHPT